MAARLKAESTLTDRYQTTVPETVRRALRLGKRDKIVYTIGLDGEVMLSRAESDQEDPALAQFLEFLARDIANHPERAQIVDEEFLQRIRTLTAGVEIDLDAPLPDDDE